MKRQRHNTSSPRARASSLPNDAALSLQHNKTVNLSISTSTIKEEGSRAAVSTSASRLPRYTRADADLSFALTDRDLDILALVESFRLASSDHILALTAGSRQGILRRLQKLFHAGLLDRLHPEMKNGGGSEKMIYAVTNRGIRELEKRGKLEKSKTDWNAANRDLHSLTIHHTLLISHIRAVLTLACRKTGVALRFWRDEGPGISDSIEVAGSDGYVRVPVAPDGYFGLQDPKGRTQYFLEADRGTMTVKRFLSKLQAYAAYWRERRHETRFGIRYFRVLTVTTSAARRDNLMAAAVSKWELERMARMFLFAEDAALDLSKPESVFEPIWSTPKGGETCSLLS